MEETITYREAVRRALREALETDERVFLMGEDVGCYGGSYACSHGLLEEFGEVRIRDTPLSESGFTGAGIGAAVAGMRPIVEIMTVNFSLLALDQIVNTAAALRHMSGGQFSVPLVVRMATGGGRQLAAQHSHSLENWFAHIPGIKVFVPATVDDARWMLGEALDDPDPVIIFEHAMLYPTKGTVSESKNGFNVEKAHVARDGTDISIVTFGGSLSKAIEAADELSKEGINAEVIDLRILRPFDAETVVKSVEKTHRVIVVDEGWKTGSFAAEIASQIMERAFDELDYPVQRICSKEVPVPYAEHLEIAALPQASDIVAKAREMV